MVNHTQTIRQLLSTNCLSVFDHFVGLKLKGLKSLDNKREAIKLIKNVKAMCASGEFKLTKFLSNSKQVLQSIDEADRRQGVKDKDLMVDLPAE